MTKLIASLCLALLLSAGGFSADDPLWLYRARVNGTKITSCKHAYAQPEHDALYAFVALDGAETGEYTLFKILENRAEEIESSYLWGIDYIFKAPGSTLWLYGLNKNDHYSYALILPDGTLTTPRGMMYEDAYPSLWDTSTSGWYYAVDDDGDMDSLDGIPESEENTLFYLSGSRWHAQVTTTNDVSLNNRYVKLSRDGDGIFWNPYPERIIDGAWVALGDDELPVGFVSPLLDIQATPDGNIWALGQAQTSGDSDASQDSLVTHTHLLRWTGERLESVVGDSGIYSPQQFYITQNGEIILKASWSSEAGGDESNFFEWESKEAVGEAVYLTRLTPQYEDTHGTLWLHHSEANQTENEPVLYRFREGTITADNSVPIHGGLSYPKLRGSGAPYDVTGSAGATVFIKTSDTIHYYGVEGWASVSLTGYPGASEVYINDIDGQGRLWLSAGDALVRFDPMGTGVRYIDELNLGFSSSAGDAGDSDQEWRSTSDAALPVKGGDRVRLRLDITESEEVQEVDVYLALVTPDYDVFFARDLPLSFADPAEGPLPLAESWTTTTIWRQTIVDLVLPSELGQGTYAWHMILVNPGASVTDTDRWIAHAYTLWEIE